MNSNIFNVISMSFKDFDFIYRVVVVDTNEYVISFSYNLLFV